MHTITVYPKQPLSLEDVQELVRSCPDGDWLIGDKHSRGVIDSEDATVYLDYDGRYRDYFDKCLDDRERVELTSRLGFTPAIALHVHASQHYPGSKTLARAICGRIVEQWGGGCSE